MKDAKTHALDGDLYLYVMTEDGWSFKCQGGWYTPNSVPREVQRLYISEGWTRIFYQELFGAQPLVYAQIEGRPR